MLANEGADGKRSEPVEIIRRLRRWTQIIAEMQPL